MNLITDDWIPVIRQNGKLDTIAPWKIAEVDNPVVEIVAPRPDFQGALYQLLIGLLQTCFAPEDEDQWLEYWEEMPKLKELQASFEKVAFAFELDSVGSPAFLQDFDLPDGETKSISALLIEAPGGKTLKDNLDHFIKRDRVNQLCPSCAATALFTLQTNAPSGGVGHRVGLRGGGPLTTLMIPKSLEATLWQKLWLNVLNQEEIESAEKIDSSILPWLGKTRISDKGKITSPIDVHHLHAYWGMPRRIRLTTKTVDSNCNLCGKYDAILYQAYRTKNYGTNYEGAWVHPLTPYRFDSKKVKPPLSLKGQQGGLGYRHWLGLTLQDNENGDKASKNIQFYNVKRGKSAGDISTASLWCFGYDMDNMKARCWYESRFPVYYLSEIQRNNLTNWATELINTAKETVKILREEVKSAWFNRPKDAKGDMTQIDAQFWQATETDFYRLLEQLAILPEDTRMAPSEIYESWHDTLRKQMVLIFETATLASTPEDMNLKRIVSAQKSLRIKFYGNKTIKALKTKANPEEVVG
jgi:CRISPR system Cascade subunit CasA